MKNARSKIIVLTSAAALALLFAVANATALTNSASANATVSAVKALPAKTVLTPAVTASSSVPDSAAEDIRDIRQPRHVLTMWFWVVVAAGVAALITSVLLIWRWVRLAPLLIGLSPHEIALERLGEARRLMDPEHAREYCFAVSQIIRGYVENQSLLHAPRLTTEEFLHEMAKSSSALLSPHRTLLGNFLNHCDLAKFAGWYYCRPDLEAMHLTAVEFVRQTSANPSTVSLDCDRAEPGEIRVTSEQQDASDKQTA